MQKGKNGSCGDTPLAVKTCHTYSLFNWIGCVSGIMPYNVK